MSYKDERPESKSITIKQAKELVCKPFYDLAKAIIPESEQDYLRPIHVSLSSTRGCALFQLEIPSLNVIECHSLNLYWSQEGLRYDHGDMTILSGFEFGVYYMNAPFEDCLDTLKHILTRHATGAVDTLDSVVKKAYIGERR